MIRRTRWISPHGTWWTSGGPDGARRVDAFATLSSFPERGAHPKELADVGDFDDRQIIVDRYRIVYRIDGRRVLIFVVADGRRDMQSLLMTRRLSQT